LPVLSEAGLLDAGTECSHCHHLTLQSESVKPKGLESTEYNCGLMLPATLTGIKGNMESVNALQAKAVIMDIFSPDIQSLIMIITTIKIYAAARIDCVVVNRLCL